MKEINKNASYTALVFGGKGYEHDVSRMGAANFILTAERIGLGLLPVYINKDGDFFVYLGDIPKIADISAPLPENELTPAFPIRLRGNSGFYTDGGIIPISRAIPLLHGDFGEDGRVQGLFESAGIELFGADTLTGALCCDKAYSKAVAREAGVETLPSLVLDKRYFDFDETLANAVRDFGFPVIVKPCRLGSSVGVSLAKCKEEFTNSLEKAFCVAERVLVEPALLDKREIECAYYADTEREIVSLPGEVVSGGELYDYELKYGESEKITLMPKADLNEDVRREIILKTKALARAFSVRHVARFDYFLLPSGKIYFNEVNTFPGMTSGSLYAAMLNEMGFSFEELVRAVVL